MKFQSLLLTLIFVFFGLSLYAEEKAKSENQVQENTKSAEECKAPKWAIAIGHEEMWKLHNGCPTKKDKENTSKN